MKERLLPPHQLLLGEVPRLNHGPIPFPIQNTEGCYELSKFEYHFLDTFRNVKHTLITDILHQQPVNKCILGWCA